MKNQTRKQKVLISGASIAGPALAHWLEQAGFEVTVVEHAPFLRPGGHGVDVRGAAVDVLKKMGVLQQVRAADTHMQGVYFVNKHGQIQAQVSEAALANESGVDIEVLRGDLVEILYNLCKDRVRFLWNNHITHLQDLPEGVEVTFKEGRKEHFDLVIGADGMHSGVRRLVFGDEAQYRSFMGCYMCLFTVDNHLNLDHQQRFYSTPGKTVALYSANNPAEAKAMFFFRSKPLQYDWHDTRAQKQLVQQAFQDQHGWETQRLLQQMHGSSDFYFDSVSQIRMDGWSKGRVALIGDAAYCPSPLAGQGSSMALVGAYVLAGELKKASGDHQAAFAAYEKTMRRFVQENQNIGKRVAGSMVEDTRFQIWMRNLMLQIPGLMQGMFKMVSHSMGKAANAIELQAY